MGPHGGGGYTSLVNRLWAWEVGRKFDKLAISIAKRRFAGKLRPPKDAFYEPFVGLKKGYFDRRSCLVSCTPFDVSDIYREPSEVGILRRRSRRWSLRYEIFDYWVRLG